MKEKWFDLDGIDQSKKGVWVWASDHFFDPAMALLLIKMEPLGKKWDKFMFPIVCLLSNILLWNVDEKEEKCFKDMTDFFSGLPNVKTYFEYSSLQEAPC